MAMVCDLVEVLYHWHFASNTLVGFDENLTYFQQHYNPNTDTGIINRLHEIFFDNNGFSDDEEALAAIKLVPAFLRARSYRSVYVILNYLSNKLYLEWNFDQALLLYKEEKLLDCFEFGNIGGKAVRYMNLANVYADKGEFELALPLYQKATEMFEETLPLVGSNQWNQNLQNYILLLADIAENYLIMGLFENAREKIDQALSVMPPVGWDQLNAEGLAIQIEDYAFVFTCLTKLEFLEGNVERALEVLDQAKEQLGEVDEFDFFCSQLLIQASLGGEVEIYLEQIDQKAPIALEPTGYASLDPDSLYLSMKKEKVRAELYEIAAKNSSSEAEIEKYLVMARSCYENLLPKALHVAHFQYTMHSLLGLYLTSVTLGHPVYKDASALIVFANSTGTNYWVNRIRNLLSPLLNDLTERKKIRDQLEKLVECGEATLDLFQITDLVSDIVDLPSSEEVGLFSFLDYVEELQKLKGALG